MTLKGLKALYADEIPLRGGILVKFREDSRDGVIGVISNVIANITGATDVTGFKGIGGQFIRHSLMEFNTPIDASVCLARADTGKAVDLYYDPDKIPGDPLIPGLMSKLLRNIATPEERKQFHHL